MKEEPVERYPSGVLGVKPSGYYGDRSETRVAEYRYADHLNGRTHPDARPINFAPDLSDFLAVRFRPWFLILWEPLAVKVPGPNLVSPYCCYMDTVIFYARPYQTVGPTRYLSRCVIDGNTTRWLEKPEIRQNQTAEFAEYGRIRHAMTFDHHVEFEGERWHVERAGVRWTGAYGEPNRWWFRYYARRARPDTRCSWCEQGAMLFYRCADCGGVSSWDQIERGQCPFCGSVNMLPATVAA